MRFTDLSAEDWDALDAVQADLHAAARQENRKREQGGKYAEPEENDRQDRRVEESPPRQGTAPQARPAAGATQYAPLDVFPGAPKRSRRGEGVPAPSTRQIAQRSDEPAPSPEIARHVATLARAFGYAPGQALPVHARETIAALLSGEHPNPNEYFSAKRLRENPELASLYAWAPGLTAEQVSEARKSDPSSKEGADRLRLTVMTSPTLSAQDVRSLSEDDLASARFIPPATRRRSLNADVIGDVLIGGKVAFYKGTGEQSAFRESLMADLHDLAGVATPAIRPGKVPGGHSEGGFVARHVEGVTLGEALEGEEDHHSSQARWGEIEGTLRPGELDRALLFSVLAGVEDRHLGNYMIEGDRLVSIDHEFSLWPRDMTSPLSGDALINNDLTYLRPDGAEFDRSVIGEMVDAAGQVARRLRDAGGVASARWVLLHGEALDRLRRGDQPANQATLSAIMQEIRKELTGQDNPPNGWWKERRWQ